MLAYVVSLLLAISQALNSPVMLAAPPAPAWYGGRVYTNRWLHIGVRPALLVDNDGGAIEVGAGITVQITCDVP